MPNRNYLKDYSELAQKMTKGGVKFTRFENRPWWLKAAFTVLTFFTKVSYDNYTQCINKGVYLPEDWDNYSYRSRYYTLIHEFEHFKQFKKYSAPLMGFLYLCVFFPVGLAYFRAKFEREAILATLVEKKKLGESVSLLYVIEKYNKRFCGKGYAYAWPFKDSVTKWAIKDYESL